ncbi:MAG: hypothetical protein MUF72_03420 [Elainella sp. Prado103]|jgi:uncharacterized membrane protein|nr:hypothetical protein [Elainella sp. Prado103]
MQQPFGQSELGTPRFSVLEGAAVKPDLNRRLHIGLLLFWTLLGCGLRFMNLSSKPLWTDEFSTIVFSLGNSFLTVPLDQLILTNQLLAPLRPSGAGVGEVIGSLLRESNHPPLYFILSHWWLKLFAFQTDQWVTAGQVRSLAALFGVLSIPFSYLLSWLSFRSRVIAQTTAALMAVSPFGIYLAQEARHYTLPLIWILISLCFLVTAARRLRDRHILPLWFCLSWILVNGLGIATHYFFVFTLAAEAIVIANLGLVQSWRESGIWYPSLHWRRVWLVAGGTAASGLVWWPVLQNIQDGELTRWIYQGTRSEWGWLDPIGQAIAGWVTMLFLLPIQAPTQGIATISGIALVLLILWISPKLFRGMKVQLTQRESRLGIWVLGTFVLSAIVIFFSVIFFFDANLMSAFRYNFVYFPAVIALVGAGLGSSWDVAIQIARSPLDQIPPALLSLLRVSNRKTVILVWLLGLLGALTVLTNLGYQKTHRPDRVAADIQQFSEQPVLIAMPHRSHGQTGRLMGVALALQGNGFLTQPATPAPRFLLAHETQNPRTAILTLRRAMNELPRPLDLWLLNFHEVPEQPLQVLLQQNQCQPETRTQSVDGYRYRLYRCTDRPVRRSDSSQTDPEDTDSPVMMPEPAVNPMPNEMPKPPTTNPDQVNPALDAEESSSFEPDSGTDNGSELDLEN